MNFGLRVRGRRPDGNHELESLFLPLDLADVVGLALEECPQTRVELVVAGDGPGVPAGPENLAVRAASGFLRAAGLRRLVRVRLVKRIPAAAGLGGGSSDAAAVLRGLAQSLPDALDAASLERLALELGADVPFFLDPRPSLVTGIGERREALSGHWPSFVLLLANPGAPLSTARVFEAYDASPPPPPSPALRPLVEALRDAPTDASVLGALLVNDLEPAALSLCPALAPLREALGAAGATAVGLSGSGATVFGVFRDEAEADAARLQLPEGCWSRVARTWESG